MKKLIIQTAIALAIVLIYGITLSYVENNYSFDYKKYQEPLNETHDNRK